MLSSSSFDQTQERPSVDISDLYKRCLKLCSTNKITEKNAWDLDLINHMNDIMDGTVENDDCEQTSSSRNRKNYKNRRSSIHNGNEQDFNFTRASCTLDASAKIYSARVDSVYQDMFKVLCGLSRSDPQALKNAQDMENGANRKARKIRTTKTIESDAKKLVCESFDNLFEVDPLFQKIAKKFDASGTAGLLLSNIHCVYGGALAFGGSGTGTADCGGNEMVVKKAPTTELNYTELKQVLPNFYDLLDVDSEENGRNQSSSPSPKHISNSFSNLNPYQMTVGNVNEIEDMDTTLANVKSYVDLNDHLGDEYDADTWKNPSSVYNDTTIMEGGNNTTHQFDPFNNESMMMENNLNTSIPDMMDDENNNDLDGDESSQVLNNTNTIITDYTTDAYHYFNPAIFKNWSGHSHWKFKGLKRNNMPQQQQKSSKKSNGPKLVDYEDVSYEPLFRIGESGASTTLSASTLSKLTAEKNILPEDVKYSVDKLFKFFLKPTFKLTRVQSRGKDPNNSNNGQCINEDDNVMILCENDIVGNENVNDFDYNNLDDMDNGPDISFGQGNVQHNNIPNSVDGDGIANNAADTLADAMDARLMLTADRRKVQTLHINYARTATKMDIGLLKKNIWKSLQKNEEKTTMNTTSTAAVDIQKTKQQQQQSFMDVCKVVPQTLPDDMADNVSVPLCFVCLLHLANEKNLDIQNQTENESMNDLLVSFKQKPGITSA